LNLGKLRFILPALYIYKNGKPITILRCRARNFFASEEELLIRINGKEILKGNQEAYHISMGNLNQGIELELFQISKAWKGKTSLGDWLAIPRLRVKGKIFVEGNSIDVSGEGYHDHNIYPVYTPFFNRGYHFGKIPAEDLKVTWARVIKKPKKEQVIVVLNEDRYYTSINPKNVRFTLDRERVPRVWFLRVDSDDLYLDVKIESINFHHISIPPVNYWRYHVKNKGVIETKKSLKKIDNLEISEYLRFF
jgi:hypothetical protein